jgi:hypothetical protein
MKNRAAIAFGMILTFAGIGVAAKSSDLAKAAGVQGGLIVHVGCEDGKLTAALAVGGHAVVQGLSENAATVAAARQQVKSAGKYGETSVAAYDGKHLPYVAELVNLLVVTKPGGLSAAEIKRVLVPGGLALVKAGQKVAGLETTPAKGLDGWRAYRKPRPKTIDDWTHYLHDARGTSVSDDVVAGHPRGLRWTGGPYWARSHEHTAGMNAMVSTAGRVFYVMDEGLVDSIQLPAENFLTARDAFNGVVLWKRPLRDWFNALYPVKSGPGWLPRRLVAVGERVYIAPGVGQDLLCLDAATGEVVRTYADTANTFELIVCGGTGAGADFDGADAVHSHMTNTRITDVEILERRFGVRLLAFAIRRGSGGVGRHRGGDGVVRRIEFLEPLSVSLLTQRRLEAPFGLAGGGSGMPGCNLLRRRGDPHDRRLPPLAQFDVAPGDILTIRTPGGGGYGQPSNPPAVTAV